MKFARVVLWIQGVYTFITAIWGLVDIQSFMMVSGPKMDIWLVKTVSVLLVAIAITWFLTLYFNWDIMPCALLALTTTSGLAAIDFYYALKGTIRWVYMVDGG